MCWSEVYSSVLLFVQLPDTPVHEIEESLRCLTLSSLSVAIEKQTAFTVAGV